MGGSNGFAGSFIILVMPTKERIEKVERVLSFRQPDLHVVLEEVTNTHNASAVVRTCDAAGILHVDIISSEKNPFPVNRAISTKAEKWLQFTSYPSTRKCLTHLKKKGFKILSTQLGDESQPYTDIDYTQPMALVFGNESAGISEEALGLSDYVVKIPMFGMAQSLNLSVSVGIILYEAIRQKLKKNEKEPNHLSKKEFETLRKKWLGL
ncbi:TrmH family RNA methyltransferase [Acidobacteriota bacterium]